MNPILKWTIWQRRWSTMWWSIAVSVFIFINMIFYPTFKDQAAELQKSFESMPEAALQLFGGSADFFSPVGFLNSQIFFLMLPLLLGILAIGLGSSLIAAEERDGTIESLMARPISRTNLLVHKILSGALIVAIVTLIGLITTLITRWQVDLDVPIRYILIATIACYLMVLSFGAVALLFTSIGKTRGAAIGLASVIAIGGYLISSLAGTVSWLEKPSKLFPFEYYDTESILRGNIEWSNLLYFIALSAVCIIVSIYTFRRRDLS